MINVTNVLREDNPRCASINLPETPADTWTARAAGSSLAVTACLSGWWTIIRRHLAAIPRRFGTRLFAATDAEARWHDWQVTELHLGLTRRYRDPRFDKPDGERR
jgi:hypothetical protein